MAARTGGARHAIQLDFQLRNRQSGEVHLVESQSTPVRDENGTVRAAIGIVRDVTPVVKGRQAVALLETIAASSDDAIITLRRDGKVSAGIPARPACSAMRQTRLSVTPAAVSSARAPAPLPAK